MNAFELLTGEIIPSAGVRKNDIILKTKTLFFKMVLNKSARWKFWIKRGQLL